MIVYPEDLPCASREGHGAEISAGLVRSPLEAGASRQRRAHDGMPHIISLSFVMQQEVYAAWLLWVNAHAWDEWVEMSLPGLDASKAGTDTAPILVKFCSDLRAELLPVHRLWYWRVAVDAEYLPNLTPPPPPLPLAAMWNPADQGRSNLTLTFTEDDRVATRTAPVNSNGASVRGVKSNGGTGKFYVELEATALGAGAPFWSFGLMSAGVALDADPTNENPAGYVAIYGNGGIYAAAPGAGGSPGSLGTLVGGSIVSGDNLGLAWTVGTGIEIYKNGVWNKTVAYTSTAQFFPWFGQGNTLVSGTNNTPGATCRLRAVPADFTYPPPVGFSPWATGLEVIPNLTWDPIGMAQSAAGVLTFVEHGRRFIKDAATTSYGVLRAIPAAAKSAGKWYFEIECVILSPDQLAVAAGVRKLDAVLGPKWFAMPAGACTLNDGVGHLMQSAGSFAFGGSAWGNLGNHVLGVAFEPGVNIKVWLGTPSSAGTISAGVALPAGTYVPAAAVGSTYTAAVANAASCSLRLRTGADLWHAPPAGYSVLA